MYSHKLQLDIILIYTKGQLYTLKIGVKSMEKLKLWKKEKEESKEFAFKSVDVKELNRINGGSDVKPETTPLCVGIIAGLTYSIKKCNK